MTNPNPAAPLTEAEEARLRRLYAADDYHDWSAGWVGSLLATLDAARATSTPAGLREVIYNLAREALATRDELGGRGYVMRPLPLEAEVRAELAPWVTDAPPSKEPTDD